MRSWKTRYLSFLFFSLSSIYLSLVDVYVFTTQSCCVAQGVGITDTHPVLLWNQRAGCVAQQHSTCLASQRPWLPPQGRGKDKYKRTWIYLSLKSNRQLKGFFQHLRSSDRCLLVATLATLLCPPVPARASCEPPGIIFSLLPWALWSPHICVSGLWHTELPPCPGEIYFAPSPLTVPHFPVQLSGPGPSDPATVSSGSFCRLLLPESASLFLLLLSSLLWVTFTPGPQPHLPHGQQVPTLPTGFPQCPPARALCTPHRSPGRSRPGPPAKQSCCHGQRIRCLLSALHTLRSKDSHRGACLTHAFGALPYS